jgi:hypothetical protein
MPSLNKTSRSSELLNQRQAPPSRRTLINANWAQDNVNAAQASPIDAGEGLSKLQAMIANLDQNRGQWIAVGDE